MISTFVKLALIAAFALVSLASAEFPLVWICLGCTVPGIAIVLFIAYHRPMEPYVGDHLAEEPIEEAGDDVGSQKPAYNSQWDNPDDAV